MHPQEKWKVFYLAEKVIINLKSRYIEDSFIGIGYEK